MPKAPTPTGTYDDVNLILRLYEMRRESRLREARSWFAAKFHATSMEEVKSLCPPGSAEEASMRMVVSYWEMAASFITGGVLSPELFFESGRELLLVWTRIEPLVAEYRKAFADPFVWHNLEKVGRQYANWLNGRAQGSYESFARHVSIIR
jgi:hypothetical protein